MDEFPRRLLDVNGPTPDRKWRNVRLYRAGDGWDVYGRHSDHRALTPVAEGVVYLGTIDGTAVEVKAGRRWKIGDDTYVTQASGCGCGGRNRALLAYTP